MPVTANGFPINTTTQFIAVDLDGINGVTLGSPSAYGTSPGAVNVQGVNAYVTNTVAVSGTVTADQGGAPWTQNLTEWAGTTLGTPTNFGTTPGAVIVGSVNSSIFSGTTALTNTGGSLNVNITGGATGTTEYNNGSTPTPPISGVAVMGVDASGVVHVLNTDTLSNLLVEPAAPSISLLTSAAINTSTSGNQTIIAGVGGKTIRIMELDLQVSSLGSGSTTITFKDGTSTALTGGYYAQNGWSWGRINNGDPAFITSSGNGFVITTSNAAQLSGYVKFTQS